MFRLTTFAGLATGLSLVLASVAGTASVQDAPALARATFTARGPFEPTPLDAPAIEAELADPAKEAHHRPRSDLPVHAVDAQPGQVVADIGCGDGRITLQLLEAVGAEGMVLAREVNEGRLEQFRTSVAEAPPENLELAMSEVGDANLPEESVDVALLADVYQFVIHGQDETRDPFLASIYSALKPGGVVVVCYARSYHLKEEDRNEPFYLRTLEDFAGAGFEPGRRWKFPGEDFPAQIFEFRRPLPEADEDDAREGE